MIEASVSASPWAGENMNHSLANERVVITGASRGLGLLIVKSLVARGAQVTIIARNPARTSDAERAGASVISGDATNESLMLATVADISPSVLALRRRDSVHGAH